MSIQQQISGFSLIDSYKQQAHALLDQVTMLAAQLADVSAQKEAATVAAQMLTKERDALLSFVMEDAPADA